jgi:hypothetical protein
MKLRHILLTAFSCAVLAGAAGNPNGAMNGGGSGGTTDGDGNMGKGMNDTASMVITGTIDTVDSTNSMFIVRSDTATDTIYYNDQTKMASVKNKLVKGNKVTVMYRTEDTKKMATMVTPGMKAKSKKGSGTKKSDTTTTPDTGTGGY